MNSKTFLKACVVVMMFSTLPVFGGSIKGPGIGVNPSGPGATPQPEQEASCSDPSQIWAALNSLASASTGEAVVAGFGRLLEVLKNLKKRCWGAADDVVEDAPIPRTPPSVAPKLLPNVNPGPVACNTLAAMVLGHCQACAYGLAWPFGQSPYVHPSGACRALRDTVLAACNSSRPFWPKHRSWEDSSDRPNVLRECIGKNIPEFYRDIAQ